MGYDPVGDINDPLAPVKRELERIHGLVKTAVIPKGTRVDQTVRKLKQDVLNLEEALERNEALAEEIAKRSSFRRSIPSRSVTVAWNGSQTGFHGEAIFNMSGILEEPRAGLLIISSQLNLDWPNKPATPLGIPWTFVGFGGRFYSPMAPHDFPVGWVEPMLPYHYMYGSIPLGQSAGTPVIIQPGENRLALSYEVNSPWWDYDVGTSSRTGIIGEAQVELIVGGPYGI